MTYATCNEFPSMPQTIANKSKCSVCIAMPVYLSSGCSQIITALPMLLACMLCTTYCNPPPVLSLLPDLSNTCPHTHALPWSHSHSTSNNTANSTHTHTHQPTQHTMLQHDHPTHMQPHNADACVFAVPCFECCAMMWHQNCTITLLLLAVPVLLSQCMPSG
jgi:hypothetical protein